MNTAKDTEEKEDPALIRKNANQLLNEKNLFNWHYDLYQNQLIMPEIIYIILS